ncbi:MAG: alpha-galactosidase, partial [Oscillospiraceae bacterium]|nr:alpha-galactosidase [Oscillospiraceae bacterium]
YDDYPVTEWTAWVTNESETDTPLLQDVKAVDTRLTARNTPLFLLSTNRGDICTASSYEPIEKTIRYGDSQYFAPVGGRPTSDALPFFNLEWDDCGVILGMGWPGQWCARFHSDKKGELRVAAGQEITRMVLRPGEQIRTPLVVFMFRGGGLTASQNMWRQWMLDCNMQKIRGKRVDPFNSMCPGLMLTEKSEIETIDFTAKSGVGIEYHWTDAGWYPLGEKAWQNAGTWRSDSERYPGTYRAVSDYAHENKMKTVLWFEAERVSPGSELARHKNWLLSLPGDKKSYRSDKMEAQYMLKNGQFAAMESYRNQLVDGDMLFNLGDDEARGYLTELISNLIKDYAVDCYRTDFNIAPLEFWLSADEPDRRGITENKYITGFLKFWDELQARFPGVVFDTCSSGGRRNDLETLRRAIPLLRSDFQVNPICAEGNQGHTYGLSSWIPFAGTGCSTGDLYLYRSHLCPFMGIGYSGDTAKWKKAAEDWRAVCAHFYGDFYPLTEYSLSPEKWIAWQFHTPGSQAGMIQAFRRSNCLDETISPKLQALIAEAEYEVENLDESVPLRYTGSQLMNGDYVLALPEAPCSGVIKYKKIL